MAKPDHSLDPLILASARWEFLEKGFEKASLKHICENANVTTGALYKRYSGKEELFAAVHNSQTNTPDFPPSSCDTPPTPSTLPQKEP